MTEDGTSLWGLLTVVGPIVLIVAILWAVLNNRGSRRDIEETERATAANYDAESRRDAGSEER